MDCIHSTISHSKACEKLLSFFPLSCLMALLLLGACQSKTASDSELLNRMLAYHDPESNWSKLKTRLYLSSADTAGQEHTFEI
jgi:hypothetical protein